MSSPKHNVSVLEHDTDASSLPSDEPSGFEKSNRPDTHGKTGAVGASSDHSDGSNLRDASDSGRRISATESGASASASASAGAGVLNEPTIESPSSPAAELAPPVPPPSRPTKRPRPQLLRIRPASQNRFATAEEELALDAEEKTWQAEKESEVRAKAAAGKSSMTSDDWSSIFRQGNYLGRHAFIYGDLQAYHNPNDPKRPMFILYNPEAQQKEMMIYESSYNLLANNFINAKEAAMAYTRWKMGLGSKQDSGGSSEDDQDEGRESDECDIALQKKKTLSPLASASNAVTGADTVIVVDLTTESTESTGSTRITATTGDRVKDEPEKKRKKQAEMKKKRQTCPKMFATHEGGEVNCIYNYEISNWNNNQLLLTTRVYNQQPYIQLKSWFLNKKENPPVWRPGYKGFRLSPKDDLHQGTDFIRRIKRKAYDDYEMLEEMQAEMETPFVGEEVDTEEQEDFHC